MTEPVILKVVDGNAPSVVDYARRYIERGWAPVPIPKGSKGPRGKDWGQFKATAETAADHFHEGQNIGIILGARSGGLVDVDLDCPEAVALAPAFLPSTGTIFGRKSKPRSHYFYRVRDNTEAKATIPFKDNESGVLVELRIGGGDKAAQTMVPPSIHPDSGEAVRWDVEKEPAEVAFADLKGAVTRLAVAVVILRAYPPKGLHARHAAAQTLGGFLARVGWDAETVADFAATIADAADDDEVRDRRRTALDAAQAHARGEKSFGLPKMMEVFGEETARKIAAWLDYSESDAAEILERMNDRFCAVHIKAKFRILSFDGPDREPLFFQIDDFKNMHMNVRVPVVGTDGKTKWIPKGQWWLTHPDRRQYDGLIFEPGGRDVIDGRLNLWRGWGVEPKKGDWSRLRAHIEEVLASGSEIVFEYILRWTAWTLQHPAEPAEVAVVSRGGEGTGKGLFYRGLCKIFGLHSRHVSSVEQLIGKFNAGMMRCSFLFSDEAFWPGHKAGESQIKRMITEPTLDIEPKGIDAFEVKNHLHIGMASNKDWVVPASHDARRYMVNDVSDHRQGDFDYFKALYREMENGGLAAMLHELLAVDLGDWHPRYNIPQTDALADQKLRSLQPLEQWWLELLKDGYLPGVEPQDRNQRRALSADLFRHARETVPRLRDVSEHAFGRFLTTKGCLNGKDRKGGHRAWVFPPLAEARAKFAETIPVEWDDAEEWTIQPM